MNLSLGFPDSDANKQPGEKDNKLGVARRNDLEAAVASLRSWMQEPNSPIRAIRHQPAKPAEYSDYPDGVQPRLRGVLARRGIENLYKHQVESFRALSVGANAVVVTPTASG